MKISKLFHWLYASVMFLPLLILPLFGIWSINHDHNEPITIDVTQNLVVDFNQRVKNGNFVDDTGWVGSSAFTYDNSCTLIDRSSNTLFVKQDNLSFTSNHKYLVSFDFIFENRTNAFTSIGVRYPVYYSSNNFSLIGTTDNTLYHYAKIIDFGVVQSTDTFQIQVWKTDSVLTDFTLTMNNLMAFDLTQMFGSGNEPSISQFDNIFTAPYYDYTSSDEMLLKDVSIATYSDTDVGSQFLYTLYNSTEKYLNFDDVLNLGAISDWINQNVFNGNAPLVFYIVWHYLDYWLILSIFWLCFDVLIYVPNIAHRWLDKASLE